MTTEKTQKSTTTSRPPVVVILGHVDHGKTSLLDYIRKTKVTEKEAGGITQHVGAYQITHYEAGNMKQGRVITFIDTPGHEAFTAIRSRGANVADVAILVVAADEGVKPQTKESIKILKESETPFVVALNKIDKNGANPQKVRQELAETEVLVEDYGGQVPVAEVSAQSGDGIDHLLELVLLLSELEELSADPKALSSGVVIEAHVDQFKGVVATLLVRNGTLSIGEWIVAGTSSARVKALEDFAGKRLKDALPSQPCVVMGWESLPALGQEFNEVKDKKAAETAVKNVAVTQGALFAYESTTELVTNLVVKADVQSSLEAVDQTLRTIKSEKVSYRVVDFGVGNISDADVKNAKAKDAAVVGFNVSIDKSAQQMAEREGIALSTHKIIYELVEAVRALMTKLLPVEFKRNDLGKLRILATFGTSGKSQIVGGKVGKGKAVRGALIDVVRNGEVAGKGRLVQLQQNKVEAKEVADGNECGIKFEQHQDAPVTVQEGDVFEMYEEERIQAEL